MSSSSRRARPRPEGPALNRGHASTLAAAALFNPLRLQVQRLVDHRFNRARYDADQTIAAFAAQLRDSVDLDSVRDDLAAVMKKAWNRPTYQYGSEQMNGIDAAMTTTAWRAHWSR